MDEVVQAGPVAAGVFHAAVGVDVEPGTVDWEQLDAQLVPGAHVAFAYRDGYWLEAVAAQRAGFEIRDSILWQHHDGTAHVLLARKSLHGTVAANVLAHGAGAINVDACRVPLVGGIELGRFPTNLLLSHAPGCALVGTKTVTASTNFPSARPAGGIGVDGHVGQAHLDGWHASEEAVEDWVCAPGCPIHALDEAVGTLKSGTPGRFGLSGADREGNRGATYGAESRPAGTPMTGYGDEGTPSRFFPTFPAGGRPVYDWLVRLVAPADGHVRVVGAVPEPSVVLMVERDPDEATAVADAPLSLF